MKASREPLQLSRLLIIKQDKDLKLTTRHRQLQILIQSVMEMKKSSTKQFPMNVLRQFKQPD